MKILVLGDRGMLGQAVRKQIAARGHTDMTPRRATPLDIRHIIPSNIKSEAVINCAGLVKQRAKHDSSFIATNSYGPHWLAECCIKANARLVHISTDCVFAHPGPHDEDDFTSGSDIYALSKRAGEVTTSPHVTVRTSFVGIGNHGLVYDILTQHKMIASSALLWSGHTAETVAELLVILAERPDISGLLHIPGEFQSRFELVQRLAAWLSRDIEIVQQDDFIQDRRLISKYWSDVHLPAPLPFLEQLARMELT